MKTLGFLISLAFWVPHYVCAGDIPGEPCSEVAQELLEKLDPKSPAQLRKNYLDSHYRYLKSRFGGDQIDKHIQFSSAYKEYNEWAKSNSLNDILEIENEFKAYPKSTREIFFKFLFVGAPLNPSELRILNHYPKTFKYFSRLRKAIDFLNLSVEISFALGEATKDTLKSLGKFISTVVFFRSSIQAWSPAAAKDIDSNFFDWLEKFDFSLMNFLKKTPGFLKHSALFTLDKFLYFFPVPLPVRVRNRLSTDARLRGIFEKIYQSQGDEIILNTEDEKYLKDLGLLEAFRSKARFANELPYFPLVHRSISNLYTLGVYFYFLSNLALYQALEDPQNRTDPVQYLEQELKSHQIQIIFEQVPFPHMAIRIGDRVYNYGLKQFLSFDVATYFAMTQNNFLNSKNTSAADNSMIQDLTQAWTDWPDSKVVFTVDAEIEKVDRLFQFLEQQSYKKWENHFFVNTCSSMCAEALKIVDIDIPWVAEPSPGQTMSYFFTKYQWPFKTEKRPFVSRFQYVVFDKTQTHQEERLVYQSQIETKLFLFNFVWLRLFEGTYFGITHNSDNTQYFTDEVLQGLKQSAREQVIQEFHKSNPTIISLSKKIKLLAKSLSDGRLSKENRIQLYHLYFTQWLSLIEQENSKITSELQQSRVPFERQLKLKVLSDELDKLNQEMKDFLTEISKSF
jgi:hypothetical protein